MPEPTVDSSVAVTESSDVAAPFAFAAAPAQVDPCAAATLDERGPDVDHTAAAEHRTSGSDRAAGSHHQCGCQRWRWTWRDRFPPATGSDTSIAIAVAAALLASGVALAGGWRRRDERR